VAPHGGLALDHRLVGDVFPAKVIILLWFFTFACNMSLWVDKYRPTTLQKLDYHKDQAVHLKKLVRIGPPNYLDTAQRLLIIAGM